MCQVIWIPCPKCGRPIDEFEGECLLAEINTAILCYHSVNFK